jgi:hypothetical protein
MESNITIQQRRDNLTVAMFADDIREAIAHYTGVFDPEGRFEPKRLMRTNSVGTTLGDFGFDPAESVQLLDSLLAIIHRRE